MIPSIAIKIVFPLKIAFKCSEKLNHKITSNNKNLRKKVKRGRVCKESLKNTINWHYLLIFDSHNIHLTIKVASNHKIIITRQIIKNWIINLRIPCNHFTFRWVLALIFLGRFLSDIVDNVRGIVLDVRRDSPEQFLRSQSSKKVLYYILD